MDRADDNIESSAFAAKAQWTQVKVLEMGIGTWEFDVLLRLRKEGYIPDHASMIEIGAQQLANSALEDSDKIQDLAQSFGVTSAPSLPHPTESVVLHGGIEHLDSAAPPARGLWRWLGFDYAAIDIDESPESVALDLNFDNAPASAVGKYDLVTNFGTTEHIANQLNAFKVIHDLTKLGGVMWHTLPAQGMLNHGLINYNPKFFWMLARSNGYKWLYMSYGGIGPSYPIPENIIDHMAQFTSSARDRLRDVRVSDAGVGVVLQKVFDIPFVPPLDVITGATTSNSVLADRYWTVFTPGAFDKLNKHATFRAQIYRIFRRLGVTWRQRFNN
jgi:hypothetical protein